MTVRSTYRFARVPEWVLHDVRLSGTDIRVYAALDRFDGRACFPSLAAVGEKIGASEDTVRRSIKALTAVGAVLVTARATDEGRQTSNEYTLAGDAPLQPRPGKDATLGGSKNARDGGGTVATRTREQDPEQEEPTPRLTPERRIEEEFTAFYANYPRHEGRGHALKAYRAAIKKAQPNVILEGLARAKACWKRERTEKRHIPLPATWLNGERWLDELGDSKQSSTFGQVAERLRTAKALMPAAQVVSNELRCAEWFDAHYDEIVDAICDLLTDGIPAARIDLTALLVSLWRPVGAR